MAEREGPKRVETGSRAVASCEGCRYYFPERSWDCRPDEPASCAKLGRDLDGSRTPADCPFMGSAKPEQVPDAVVTRAAEGDDVPQEIKAQFPDIVWYRDFGWVRAYPTYYIACVVRGELWQHRSFSRGALSAAIAWIEAQAPKRQVLVTKDNRMAPWVVLSYRKETSGFANIQVVMKFDTEAEAQRYFDECSVETDKEVYLLEVRAFKGNRG